METKQWLVALGTLGTLGTLGALGFSQEVTTIQECKVVSKKWVVANFSEIEFGVDSEGLPDTTVNRWSEPASEVHEAITINGELFNGNSGNHPVGSYYVPHKPATWGEVQDAINFDGYQARHQTTLYITTDKDTFTDPVKKNLECISKLKSHVFVKTWYGISYSMEY